MNTDMILAIALGMVLGPLTHELVHANVALLLGANVRFDIVPWQVRYQFPGGAGRIRLALVNLSPYAVVAGGAVAWYVYLLPNGVTPLTVGVLVYLAVMGIGSYADLSFSPTETGEEAAS